MTEIYLQGAQFCLSKGGVFVIPGYLAFPSNVFKAYAAMSLTCKT